MIKGLLWRREFLTAGPLSMTLLYIIQDTALPWQRAADYPGLTYGINFSDAYFLQYTR